MRGLWGLGDSRLHYVKIRVGPTFKAKKWLLSFSSQRSVSHSLTESNLGSKHWTWTAPEALGWQDGQKGSLTWLGLPCLAFVLKDRKTKTFSATVAQWSEDKTRDRTLTWFIALSTTKVPSFALEVSQVMCSRSTEFTA